MAESKRCEQCGREGTRGFRTLPDEDVIADGPGGGVLIWAAHSLAECTGKVACRRRQWKLAGGAAGAAARMAVYE